ncbi:MotA/TolQ/ExbB proton channel family protein [Alteromonas sp. ASW11-36]|uniref:MotA/TolQ/ExbB proton channel family protein n=1 Tax=Alteromonas arenosi TaxID=3055817 RepID=A0ABT7SUF7_9ALTE|nr:MotA/TolQ/ExbB proton channel family protein [Alteromonas sp. ASW11-36]MDM7859828.1 MotA/TolQ/ExbB proton channel family protein [Alteromonas sp. ASW11-36]
MKQSIWIVFLVSLCCSMLVCAQDTEAEVTDEQQVSRKVVSLDQLLEQVKEGNRTDTIFNQQRIAEFRQAKDKQAAMLADIQRQREVAEALSATREQMFEDNDQQITLLQERLSERLGALKELFGVLQLVANDTQAQFENSLVQIHYPQRTADLNAFSTKMGSSTELPTVEEIEALWFELQREMTESGKIVMSQQTVLNADGEETIEDVIRVGTFNLVANGKYVQRIMETGRLVEFARQPSNRYMSGAEAIADKSGELVAMTIDPVRGQLIALMGAAPDLRERVQQGGVIGYIILSLGAVVIVLALIRYVVLMIEDARIRSQLTQLDNPGNNALGRIIKVYLKNRDEGLESLELKLGEAVLREIPKITRGLSFLKISAAIAPLLGLLGTVTGMIITFQAITLFGAGDPKLMAGGISQALVTTVLGLTVAIPALLLHNLVNDKATKLSQIIEQESVALVAVQAEKSEG